MVLLKKMKKWIQLKLPKTVKITLVSALFLLVFDVLLAVFGVTYLAETDFFFHKSTRVILSDLVFLEGATFFIIGAFILIARTSPDKRSSELRNEQTTNRKRLHEQLVRPETFMMIVGVGFIGLSIILGTLIAWKSSRQRLLVFLLPLCQVNQ